MLNCFVICSKVPSAFLPFLFYHSVWYAAACSGTIVSFSTAFMSSGAIMENFFFGPKTTWPSFIESLIGVTGVSQFTTKSTEPPYHRKTQQPASTTKLLTTVTNQIPPLQPVPPTSQKPTGPASLRH